MMKTPQRLSFVWDQLQKAIIAYNKGLPLPNCADVITAINESNIELAKKLISDYNI